MSSGENRSGVSLNEKSQWLFWLCRHLEKRVSHLAKTCSFGCELDFEDPEPMFGENVDGFVVFGRRLYHLGLVGGE